MTEQRTLIFHILTELSQGARGVDGWRYFLMSGLALGFAEGSEEAGAAAVANLQKTLGANLDERVSFEDAEILEAAANIFDKIAALSLNRQELAQAVLDDAVQVARHYEREGVIPLDISWTCFQFGWKSRYLASTTITLVDPQDGTSRSYGPWKD